MKTMPKLLAVAVLALAVASLAPAADEVTLAGKIACAKCTLKKADAKECQNVLLVPGADGKDVEYYVTKNNVDKKFGEVCMETPQATVTGVVSEKEGRKWITASKMEKAKS